MDADEHAAALQRIGRNIKVARARTGDTQESLARRAGMNSTQVARMERGEVAFQIVQLLRVAAALGASAADLLEGTTPDPNTGGSARSVG